MTPHYKNFCLHALILFILSVSFCRVYGNFGDEILKIVPGDISAGMTFGYSVALSEDYGVVGARWDDVNGDLSGSVYLYDALSIAQIDKIFPANGMPGDKFGNSVAVENNLALIGAPGDDGNLQDVGSAYLYDITAQQFIMEFAPTTNLPLENFGTSVAIDNGLAIVGGDNGGVRRGTAYTYDLNTRQQLAQLITSDGNRSNRFGTSVSVDAGIAIVGAPGDDTNGNKSGSAYLFDAVTGLELRKLMPNDGDTADLFGTSVAISNGIAIVGAPGDENAALSPFGSSYFFDVATGLQIAKVTVDGGDAFGFGSSIAIQESLAIIGADGTPFGFGPGTAYLFDVNSRTQILELTASDGTNGDHFGNAVALNSQRALIGAYIDADNGGAAGSAYLYDIVPEPSSLMLAILAGLICYSRWRL